MVAEKDNGAMFKVLLCVSRQHDWRLLLVAGLVCVCGALATFQLFSRLEGRGLASRRAWLAGIGLVAGSSIWTTHFVAMLAFRTGLDESYDGSLTFASFAVAVLGSWLAVALASRPRKGVQNPWPTAGGLTLGVAIVAMHYVGMSGYRTQGLIVWDWLYVAASVVLGVALATGAFCSCRPGDGIGKQSLAGALLAAGILAAHLTGMTAVTIVPDPSVRLPASDVRAGLLGTFAIVGSAFLIFLALVGVALEILSGMRGLERLKVVLNTMSEGLALFDAQGRLLIWNSRYADLARRYGVTVAAGMTSQALLRSVSQSGMYRGAAGREGAWSEERRLNRLRGSSETLQLEDGSWSRITSRPLPDGGSLLVTVDVTDLKEAEDRLTAALRDAQEHARETDFAENLAQLGHWRLNPETGAITWSRQLFLIHGLDENEPLDLQRVMSMIHPDDRAQASRVRTEQMSGRRNHVDSVKRICRPDGEIRYVAGKSCVERSQNGAVIAVVGTMLDVTSQVRLEQDLRQARAEAEAAVAVKSDFLATMSHEIRTPLTSIVGFTDLAKAQLDVPQTIQRYIDRIDQAGRSLLCTVNDVLDFSKLEAGEVAFQLRPVSIPDLTRACFDLFAPQAGAKDVDLNMAADDLDRPLLLDPDRMRQILLNLIGNAVKFTDSGSVTVNAGYDSAAETLLVAVVDTGPGMPQDKLGLLFRRFSQIGTLAPRTTGGTGLGLAICKGLVEAMGGEIGVESRLGSGSRFWFKIPAKQAEGACYGAAATQADISELRGLRILVVDDHKTNRELVRLFLDGVGAEITEAVDGSEAVELTASFPYDVILMDLNMPGMNGREAMARIRSGGPNDSVPILAFTAASSPEERAGLIGEGFDDMVEKPIDPTALIAAVARAAAYLYEPPAAQPPPSISEVAPAY